uniref:Putative tick transposon n=1 Tax=Rhipicephalus microplus TaxID=6941 RepID=A0A6M2DBA7_RHIMP
MFCFFFFFFSKVICNCLLQTFTRCGFPNELITKNATYFAGRVFGATCKVLGVHHKETTLYHPQANITECVNIKP